MIWKQGEFNEEVKPGFVCLAALPFDGYGKSCTLPSTKTTPA